MRARRPCAYHFSWLQDLSDDEILHWPEIPPSFPEDMSSVRDQVRGELGRVDVPPTWDGTHSENPETKKKDVVWFALNEDRLLFAFGGLWTEIQWRPWHQVEANARTASRLWLPDDGTERGWLSRSTRRPCR